MLWFNNNASTNENNYNHKTRLVNDTLIQQFSMALKDCDWSATSYTIAIGNPT